MPANPASHIQTNSATFRIPIIRFSEFLLSNTHNCLYFIHAGSSLPAYQSRRVLIMSKKAMLRSSLLGLFILVGLAFTNVSQSSAQTGKDESMTVQEFKGYLAQTHRDLSMAKQEELTMLKPGSGSF